MRVWGQGSGTEEQETHLGAVGRRGAVAAGQWLLVRRPHFPGPMPVLSSPNPRPAYWCESTPELKGQKQQCSFN